jgi:hypothetical protein
MEDLDPEDARGVIDPALKLMIEAVQRYDGYVVQSTGDGNPRDAWQKRKFGTPYFCSR